ncbi:DNA-directed RNA polymerase subunit H [archaeon]|nr:DNA-directed RNA polymerase subunit H [archaeon]
MEEKKQEIKHVLVPKHIKLSDDKANELLAKLNVSKKQLPKISIKDPAIQHMDVQKRDIIEIRRNSPTIGESIFYRVVI